MNTGKRSNTVELEVTALLMALVVIACAVTAIIKGEFIHTCLSVMTAVGGVMNLLIAMIRWKKGRKKQSSFWVLLMVLLMAAFVMLQIYR